MKVNEIVKAIVCAYPARQPLMVWGAPGVGKSSAAKKAAAVLRAMLAAGSLPGEATAALKAAAKKPGFEFGFIDLRLPLLEPVDLRGLPYVKEGVAYWSRPVFLPTGGYGLLFLDELVQAGPAMQSAASQLVLDRCIGEYRLPDGWMVIAAGNRASDRAAVNAMPTHIANRFVHLQTEINVEAWVAWALEAKLDMRVIAYIKWKGAPSLHSFDPQAKVLAFPSPRSWEFVSKLLGSFSNLNDPILGEMIKGAIGDGEVASFLAFCKMFDKLPNIDNIFLNPKRAEIPQELSVLWAVVTSVSSRVTVDNIDKVVIYFNRITDESGRPEFSVAAMKEIALRDEERPAKQKIMNTPAFITWASKHNELIV
jgi:hypothetical protein